MKTPTPTLALALALTLTACGGDGGSTDAATDSFDRRSLLRNAAENIIVPTLADLDAAAATMVTAVDAYCRAIDGADETTALASARAAWSAAMEKVQLAEVMRIGPAAVNDNELRDELYSWPLASTCGVDQEVKIFFDDPTGFDISGRLVNRRGMDALEYVLFATSLEHTCPATVEPEGWDALTELERKTARCGYAAASAADVESTAGTLLEAWSAGGGNFLSDFAGAGTSDSSFASAQQALNVLSDAMFFVEFEVKDIKLGEPAGISVNSCGVVGEACIEELESQFATHTKENLVANLRAFELLFTGGAGVGFDDMLVELGASELAQTMTADIAAMVAAAEAIPGTLRDALTTDYAAVTAAHAAIKVVTDNLKSQFLTVLGLDIPDNSAGDND